MTQVSGAIFFLSTPPGALRRSGGENEMTKAFLILQSASLIALIYLAVELHAVKVGAFIAAGAASDVAEHFNSDGEVACEPG